MRELPPKGLQAMSWRTDHFPGVWLQGSALGPRMPSHRVLTHWVPGSARVSLKDSSDAWDLLEQPRSANANFFTCSLYGFPRKAHFCIAQERILVDWLLWQGQWCCGHSPPPSRLACLQ